MTPARNTLVTTIALVLVTGVATIFFGRKTRQESATANTVIGPLNNAYGATPSDDFATEVDCQVEWGVA